MNLKLRILILEDLPTDAVLMERELQNSQIDFTTKRVEKKEDFLKELGAFNPDLILSDYSLPRFDGMSALELAKSIVPNVPFIVVTGAINEETAVECMKAGAIDYVIKDHLGRLGPAVKGAMEKMRAMDERKIAEEALIASEIRYRRLFESAREGILLLDANSSRITDANPFMATLINCPRNEILGKGLWELGLFKDQTEFQSAFQGVLNDEYAHFEDLLLELTGGQKIHVEMTCNSYLVENKRVVQCNIRDITSRLRVEEEKDQMQEQLFQSQKMEAIGTLAGGMAHDFNNLMTAIQVSTDVAMMKINEDDLLYRDFKEIRLAALRASGLIRQLLLFSRKHPLDITALSLNGIVENLFKMLRRLISEDIEIAIQLDPELCTIRADTGNMEQVVMNLSLNARDAMPKGGKLRIVTENRIIDEAFHKIVPESRPGKFVCLSVIDTGIGMDRSTLQRIFEPFYTTKGPGMGTGLGLSVVYGIVSQHEGWIRVLSKLNQGSTFEIYLPVFSGEPEDRKESKFSVKEIRGKGERILLVEDEEKVRESTEKAMIKCGYQVTTARNAEEAIQIFKQEKGKFHLVFSDVVLSDRSGIELVDELVSIKHDLNILLSSGYTDHKSQWPLIRQRGFRFLKKPYNLSDLIRAIQEAIG